MITGVVRDEETKQPFAGAIVASDALDGVSMRSGGALSATTDAEGRYRLDGLRGIAASPSPLRGPIPLTWKQTSKFVNRARWSRFARTWRMRRGFWAVGRPFNIKTGQPVAATLFYTPFRSE